VKTIAPVLPASSRRAFLLGTTAAALVAACQPTATTPAVSPAAEDTLPALTERVATLVQDRFFDAARGAAWAGTYREAARGVNGLPEWVALTRRKVAELGASHTTFVTSDDLESWALRAIFDFLLKGPPVELEGIGADITVDGFVRVLFTGGPAEKAGLLRGDRIVTVDGAPFHRIHSWQGKAGRAVTLAVQRRADEKPVATTVTPRKAALKSEWLEHQRSGTRVIPHAGKRVGYMPMFFAGGTDPEDALREAVMTTLKDADALIFDIRNGWGGANPTMVSIFDRAPAILSSADRKGQWITRDSQWRKPLFVLINGGSRSGKEVVAYSVQKHHLGTLIGENTAGAVLAGTVFEVGRAGLLYLAVEDVRVDGERLEGRGVRPDVEVKDTLMYAAGTDPQLEKALALAAQ
jgi:carboxyl-terminal processing protease